MPAGGRGSLKPAGETAAIAPAWPRKQGGTLWRNARKHDCRSSTITAAHLVRQRLAVRGPAALTAILPDWLRLLARAAREAHMRRDQVSICQHDVLTLIALNKHQRPTIGDPSQKACLKSEGYCRVLKRVASGAWRARVCPKRWTGNPFRGRGRDFRAINFLTDRPADRWRRHGRDRRQQGQDRAFPRLAGEALDGALRWEKRAGR